MREHTFNLLGALSQNTARNSFHNPFKSESETVSARNGTVDRGKTIARGIIDEIPEETTNR